MAEYSIEYHPEPNIMVVTVSGVLNEEDLDNIIEKERKVLESLEFKTWYISDMSLLGPFKLDVMKQYVKITNEYKPKYVYDYCFICTQIFQKFSTMFYNFLKGETHPVFYTKMEAYNWVAREQVKRGKFHPIDK
jgi:hypothetical protein